MNTINPPERKTEHGEGFMNGEKQTCVATALIY